MRSTVSTVSWSSWLRRGANNAKISSPILLGTNSFSLYFVSLTLVCSCVLEMASACEDVLVVHIGAGFHSPKLTTAYRKLLKSSLTQDLIKSTSCVIEKSLLTNTGKGSNVDREGHASLDATYLQIKGKNVVKALSLINICDENPTNQILEANEWLDMEFSGGSLSSQFGLLRPTSLHHSTLQAYLGKEQCAKRTLVRGSMWRSYLSIANLFGSKQRNLTDDTLNERGNTNKRKRRHLIVNDVTHSEVESVSKHHSGEIDDDSGLHSDLIPCTIEDTVGIAEIKGEVITAVTSSGGNFFKIPGRVSCAGIMGAGIAYSCKDQIQVITICTGNGDDITRMGLAGFLSEQIATQVSITSNYAQDLGSFLVAEICRRSDQYSLSSVDSQGNPRIYVGVIVLLFTPEYQSLLFCHSTESFYFAFKLKNEIEIVMSRKDPKTNDFLHGEYRL